MTDDLVKRADAELQDLVRWLKGTPGGEAEGE
jgi:hypothetical protein